ncbi:TerD family protein [Nocardioides dongkuii]|uniref:TerD family protein n=1 Tax=Nocardioides dongkuii TaxID=2760089 RepID=UPI0015F8581B|nr:TerD family protein [Nocardioides dongkuii]
MIELHQGEDWTLATETGEPVTRLRLGVGWDKERGAGFIGSGAPDVDLDASAVQFAGGKLFDLAFYNHLRTRDGSVEHQGDNRTGDGEGDDEVISVDLDRVHGPVDTIIFLVSSYQGHSLEWVDRAYCRLVDEHDTELARFRLTAGVPQTGLAMAGLYRDGDRWRLRAIGEGVDVKVPSDAVTALRRFV